MTHTHRHLEDEETHTHQPTTTDTHTHTLSERGTEGVTWAWQLLSSLTVSLSPWRTLSTNPQKKWFLAHRLSTSPQGQGRRGSSRAEAGRDLWQPPVPPICPSSRQQLWELQPCSAAWEKGPRAQEWREPGLGNQEGAWHSVSLVGVAWGNTAK